MIRKRLKLLSNHEHLPRHTVYEWGSYDMENVNEAELYDEDLDLIKKLFENNAIKWYLVYEEVLNLTTAQLTIAMVESAAHEEIPPIEFNVKAKNTNPTLVFKTDFVDW